MSRKRDEAAGGLGAQTLDLEAVAILCAVDRERSVSSAAQACGVPRSTAWRKLEQLEAALGCRLVERSARHLRLTAAGVALVARGRALLQDAAAAVAEIRGAAELGGVITVGMPPGPPALVLAALTPFATSDDGPAFYIYESAGALHPLKDDFDLIVTMNRPEDGDLYVRLLDTARWSCMAAPSYLEGRAPVRDPDDLQGHRLFSFYLPPRSPNRWSLRGGGSLPVRPCLAITNAETIIHATVAGLGIGYVPWDFAPREGAALVDVLPDLIGEETAIYVVAGQRGRDSARVRLVMEAFERLRASGIFRR